MLLVLIGQAGMMPQLVDRTRILALRLLCHLPFCGPHSTLFTHFEPSCIHLIKFTTFSQHFSLSTMKTLYHLQQNLFVYHKTPIYNLLSVTRHQLFFVRKYPKYLTTQSLTLPVKIPQKIPSPKHRAIKFP
jgi:hypothetical protein